MFRSNMQVFGSTCGSHGSNQYQGEFVVAGEGEVDHILRRETVGRMERTESKSIKVG